MTRLFISIIIAVFGSLFFIGLGLDKMVERQEPMEESPDIVMYKKLVEGFALQLSVQPKAQLIPFTNQLASQFSISLTLEERSNIALPPSLAPHLDKKGGLLLATEQETFILRNIPKSSNKLIRLQLPLSAEENNKTNILFTAILYLGVCIILILWLLPLARRLYLLTTAAAKIGKGESNVRVPLSKLSYINSLETSFNQMATQIEKLMADNKLLARSLSHDIRTPMSCLRFGVEAALDSETIDKKNSYLNRMEAELTRMEEMTAAFLSYAGMERQGIHLKLETIEFNTFIEDFCRDFHRLASQYGVSITQQLLVQPFQYQLDCHWFYRALQNLLTNALQYADNTVNISLKKTPTHIEILIEDDGKGIAPNQREQIFDPFVKLDADRSREQGHFGLGLAICQKVVHWHKGTITAESATSLSGAGFRISLPL